MAEGVVIFLLWEGRVGSKITATVGATVGLNTVPVREAGKQADNPHTSSNNNRRPFFPLYAIRNFKLLITGFTD
jgi:hypothetical protein